MDLQYTQKHKLKCIFFMLTAAITWHSVWATIKTWSGGGAANTWSTTANWGAGAGILPGDALVFAGTTRLASNNDLSIGRIYSRITFNLGAGAFTLSGNQLSLSPSGVVTNNSNMLQTIGLSLFVPTATTINTANGDIELSGGINGANGLTKTGSKTLFITGANTCTGTTIIKAGTLSIGNGGVNGSITGPISIGSGANLIFNHSDSISYSLITGSGGLTQSGTGTLLLTGNGVYTGVTTINTGTLSIGNGGAVVSFSSSSIVDNAALIFNLSNSLTYAGAISGTGIFTKLGVGTLTLTGNNSYTGATTISAGILSIGNGGTSGSLSSLSIVDNATLTFNRSNALTYTGVISGAGTVTQLGAGTLTLTGNNSYTGATTISAGTLSIGNGGTSGSLASLSIVDNATLTFNRSNALTYAGAISGTGTVIKSGAGTLTLTGNNSYTGATTISAGILSFGNGGACGNITSASILNNANLIFNCSNSINYADVMSGSGSLTQAGIGTTTLSGNNQYTGQTYLNEGTILIGNNAALGNGGGLTFTQGRLETNVTFSIDRLTTINGTDATFITDVGTTLTLNGKMTGSGGLRKGKGTGGTGTLVLTNTNNDYTGKTFILAGTLIANPSTLPGNASINPGSYLEFDYNTDGTFSGGIGGAGNVIKAGDGTITMTAVQSYTGETDINQGALQTTTTSMGANSIVAHSDTALIFAQETDGTYSGNLSGDGDLIKEGTGTVNLTGTNTNTGGTFIRDGTISIGSSANLGVSPHATGSLILHGGTLETLNTLTLDQFTILGKGTGTFNTDAGTTLTMSGQVTHEGALFKTGDGTLVLSNINNNYTGDTTVNGGVLKAGVAGGLVNNAAYTVNAGELDLNNFDLTVIDLTLNGGSVNLGSAALILSQTTDAAFSGSFSGDASSRLNITNTGTFTFTSDSDSSAYQGLVDLTQGTIVMNGIMSGDMNVGIAGTLKGSGQVNNLTVSGHIAPGNSIGTLTVNGNYTQAANAVYEAELNPLGQSDLISISGTASIQGAIITLIPDVGDYTTGSRYTLLEANSISGRYATLVQPSDFPFTFFKLHYDAQHVYLDLYRSGLNYSDYAITPNQISTANALEEIPPDDAFSFSESSPFMIQGVPLARDALILNAGIRLDQFSKKNILVKINYNGQFSSHVNNNGVVVESSWAWDWD